MLNKEIIATLILVLEDYLDFQIDGAVSPAEAQRTLNALRLYSQFM